MLGLRAKRVEEGRKNEPESCDELVQRNESVSLSRISFSLHLGSPNEVSDLLKKKGPLDVESEGCLLGSVVGEDVVVVSESEMKNEETKR